MTYSKINPDSDSDFDPDDTLKLVPFGSNVDEWAKFKELIIDITT